MKKRLIWKMTLIRLLPYIAVFLVYINIRLRIIQTLGILQSEWYFAEESTSERMSAMLVGILVYLRLFIYPLHLSMDYNFPVRILGPLWAKKPESFMDPFVIAGMVFFVFYIATILYGIYYGKKWAYCLIFIGIAMFPFSNIIAFGDFLAERFLYLPSIGFFLLISLAFEHYYRVKARSKVVLILMVILLSFYSVRTIKRNGAWESSLSLWKAEMKNNPRNPNLFYGFATESIIQRLNHLRLGKLEKARGNLKETSYHLKKAREYEENAIAYFEKSIQEHPRHYLSYRNFGNLLISRSPPEYEKAEEILIKGAALMPENIKMLYVFYHLLGYINIKREPPNIRKGIYFLQKAHRIKKTDIKVLETMFYVRLRLIQYDETLKICKKVLKINEAHRQAIEIIKEIRKLDQKGGNEK